MSNPNITLLQEALTDCNVALEHAYSQRHSMLKQSEQPSPGLLQSIKHLEAKRVTILNSLELWKGYLTVCTRV